MSATQGENRAAAEIARLRKDGDAGGTAVGYDNDGRVVEVKGDDQAPFGKTPPFPTSRDVILQMDALGVGVYTATEEFDVEIVHLITVWIDYTSAEADSVLSLIPEVRDSPDNNFVPVGVLDATLTQVTLPGLTPNYGSRTFYQTELRTPLLALNDRMRVPLSFDVGPYRQFRLSAGEIGSATGGALVIAGSTSD